MSKPDYTSFDAELLRLIAAGRNRMALLDSRHGDNQGLRDLALPHCKVINGRRVIDPWQIIDRRLQALRKAGKIRHDGKVWEIVEKGGAA